jgi:hypothetical protein
MFHLEDGLTILASAWSDKPWGAKAQELHPTLVPDLGFYLDKSWAPYGTLLHTPGLQLPWARRQSPNYGQVVVYPWDDYSTPDRIRQFRSILGWLLDAMVSGRLVETGCIRGHGRTGTLLAGLLVAQGVPAWDAINRVRDDYCLQAIESMAQETFIEQLDTTINHRTEWENKPWKHIPASNDRLHGYETFDYPGATSYYTDDEEYQTWLRLNTVPLQGGVETDLDREVAEILIQDRHILLGDREPDCVLPKHLTCKKHDLGQDYIGCAILLSQGEEHGDVCSFNDWPDLECDMHDLGLREDRCSYTNPLHRVSRFGDRVRQVQLLGINSDVPCLHPPCMYPSDCDTSVGECWKELTKEQVEAGHEDWRDWDELPEEV